MKRGQLHKQLAALWSVYVTTYDCDDDEEKELVAEFDYIYNVVHGNTFYRKMRM